MRSDANSSSNYYPLFDYLRIILSITVMLSHDGLIFWSDGGNFAVQVFFALSGWLIGGMLMDASKADLPRFYFNRALRIWVPYYLALGLLICASLMKDTPTSKWVEFVFYKATFVYNLFGTRQLTDFWSLMPLDGTGNHFWSVNAEEQFYLLVPILLVLIVPLGRSLLLWFLIAAAAWWLEIYASIVFGVLAAVLARKVGPIHAFAPARVVSFGGVVVFSSALVTGMDYYAWAPLLAICIVLLLAVPGKPTPLGKFVGGISYPLYLNHWIGVFAGHALMGPFGMRDTPERQLLSALLNIGIAAALYWLVDWRILAMRNGWFTPERGRMAMWLGYGVTGTGLIVGLALANLP
ncbi:acyltransferase [Rhizobium sp. S152]|uniref:acyltransferase family protein n=1 Tax=Rhizobium sp. S152 TaxID=3055038 RepID=UPI0025A9822D|nr:acyltransferase [Rhizobium sp. S152]MDM9625778.1 acyltransferase [Rhizobium sp. S152]